MRHTDLLEETAVSALERFGRLHARSLGRVGGVIDLSFPNPRVRRDNEAFGRLRELAAQVEPEQLQYTPFGGRTPARRKVASALSRRAQVPVGFTDVFLTPGATAALVVAIDAFFRPGDEVLVITPGWMDYELYLLRRDVRPVYVQSGPDKRLEIEAVARQCGSRTAGVILSQPGCPTGVVHSQESLARLSEVLHQTARASERRIVLISDEAHRDMVWEESATLAMPMRVYPQTVSVYSFGKAWSLQGQRTGYLALGPGLRSAADRIRIDRCLRATGVCAPTALMQLLVTEMADWVPDQRSLREDQSRVRAALGEIGYAVVPGEATCFVYVQCPYGMDDWSFVDILSHHGVLALPSSVFHEPGYFRLSLNSGGDELSEAIERLRKAFRATEPPRLSMSGRGPEGSDP